MGIVWNVENPFDSEIFEWNIVPFRGGSDGKI